MCGNLCKYELGRSSNIAISQKIPWANYKTCADIGTAQGDLVAQITLAHPHLNGVEYDLPVVGPIFDDYMQTLHLSDCVKFTPGSFFTDDVPQADVLLFGHILHDLDLAAKKCCCKRPLPLYPLAELWSSMKRSSTTIGQRCASCRAPWLMSLRMVPADCGRLSLASSNLRRACAQQHARVMRPSLRPAWL